MPVVCTDIPQLKLTNTMNVTEIKFTCLNDFLSILGLQSKQNLSEFVKLNREVIIYQRLLFF
jgi:hypothetical protein